MKRSSYFAVATILLVLDISDSEAVDYQAEIDLGHNNIEFLQMMFKQIEMLGNQNNSNETEESIQTHTQVASALLKVAPVITIKGNVTDPSRSLTITFTVHASRNHKALELLLNDKESEQEEHEDWRGGGGLLSPIVGFIEPYVFSMAELVVHSIFSTAISNFLEGATLTGVV